MKRYIKIFILLIWSNALFAQWTDQSNWTHLGPTNIGSGAYETGRGDQLALHPFYGALGNQTIYLGSSMGGLWKTENDGEEWEHIPTTFPKYSGVNDLAFTSDGAFLYIADRNVLKSFMVKCSGVYKYEIGTGSWSATGTIPVQDLIVEHIKIMPDDNNKIFACTNGGLFRSLNGGVNWDLVDGIAAYHNVDFMPNGYGGYDIYGSGDNIFRISTDGGATFSNVLSGTISSFDNFYTDLKCVYVPNANPSLIKKIVYLYGIVKNNNNLPFTTNFYMTQNSYPSAYALNIYSVQGSTVQYSPSPVLTYTDLHGACYKDRLSVEGDKDVVYVTGDGLRKYSTLSSTFYRVLNADSPVPWGGVLGYSWIPIHPDHHDVKIFDNGSIRRLFVITDGGFGYSNLTYGANGVYTYRKNNLTVGWEKKNLGLNIAQVWSFAQSEETYDWLATAEQDTKGFLFNASNMAGTKTWGTEPQEVMMDRTNDDFIMMNGYQADPYLFYSKDASTNFTLENNRIDFLYGTNLLPLGTIPMFEVNDSLPFPDTIRLGMRNRFFQDPFRPQNIYAIEKGIFQYDLVNDGFAAKYTTGKFSTSTDPYLKDDGWFSRVWDIGISPQDKNAFYFVTEASDNNDLDANGQPRKVISHLYRYNPNLYNYYWDIDNSWPYYYDNKWEIITPNLNTVLGLSIPASDLYKFTYNQIEVSQWDPEKIWLTVNNIPGYQNIKVIMRQGGIWTDYSAGIPADEDVLKLIYEFGSNDGLYLGTNRAVYYRNKNMSQWQVYQNNLPHVYMNQFLINYKYNKLRAGTYGHGIWETNLKCPDLSTLAINNCINCYSASDFFKEANSITVSGSTNSVNTLVLRATDYIEFTPGSSTTILGSGANYYTYAYIHGCSSEGSTFKTPDPKTNDYLETAKASLKVENTFSVYPNPNNGVFTVVFGSSSKEKEDYSESAEAHLIVYDIMGKQIYKNESLGTERLEIDLSGYPKGMYFINYIKNDKIQSKKIVIQ